MKNIYPILEQNCALNHFSTTFVSTLRLSNKEKNVGF
jgi:hypothetical protein